MGAHGLGVDPVEGGEVAHVGEEDDRLDDVVPPAAGGGEDCGQVGENLMRLRLEAARHQLARLRVEADLTRGEEQGVDRNGLAIGADGGRGRVGVTRDDRVGLGAHELVSSLSS